MPPASQTVSERGRQPRSLTDYHSAGNILYFISVLCYNGSMSAMNKSQAVRKVCVAMNMASYAGRLKLAGIIEFLSKNRHWTLELLMADRDFSVRTLKRARLSGIDGMILLNFPPRRMCAEIARARIPAVVESSTWSLSSEKLTKLLFDVKDMADVASRHFLSRHAFKSFCFIDSVDGNGRIDTYSPDRRNAFMAALARQFIECASFPMNARDLARRIADMARPVAVLAANDLAARAAARAAMARDMRIPEDVAILGIDNNPEICESEPPALDSIAQDFRGAGRLAASLLERLMNGDTRVPETNFYGTGGIVLRGSTVASSPHWPLVKSALEFIDNAACSGACVPDVADHLGVSRRLLDLRFHEILGYSVLDAIRERRIKEVKHLLSTTDMPIARISDATGFRNPNHLKNLFKQQMSQTMREWRASYPQRGK